LLPPLTLSITEADAFLRAFDAVLADVHGPASKSWGVVADIAKATLLRHSTDRVAPLRAATPGAAGERRSTPVDPALGDVCLVTGATGFIGGHLVEALRREGYQVRCLVRPQSDCALLERLGVELAPGDLADATSLQRAAQGCRFVVHCGAMVSDWGTAEEITRVNVSGTRQLLEAAAQASVDRFIHISTTDVYGHPGDRAVAEDRAPHGFKNWYSETKLAAEREVRRVEHERGLPVVILRPATVYGPRSTDVIGELAKALRGGHMLLVDRGRAVAGLCYVENVVDAVLLSLRSEAALGQAFNLSDELTVTWRELASDLARELGCRPPRLSAPYWLANALGVSLETGYRQARRLTHLQLAPLLSRQAVQVLGKNQDFSTHKARSVLGWSPRVDYASGLQATVAWLKTSGYT
ncbi:MAG: NAD-dependent epimerase/dehydratase family protein, partial [Polyangiales bacterium]